MVVVVVVVVILFFPDCLLVWLNFFFFFFLRRRRSKRHKREDRKLEKGTGQKYIHPRVNTVKDRSLFKQESVLKYSTDRYNN